MFFFFLFGSRISKAAEIYALDRFNKHTPMKYFKQVGWKKPPKGWFTLNMDGLALGNSGRVGDGGLLCNSDGNWVNGFTRGSGNTNSCLAELWALRDGLNIAFDLGILYLGSVLIELIFAETEN